MYLFHTENPSATYIQLQHLPTIKQKIYPFVTQYIHTCAHIHTVFLFSAQHENIHYI